jgi:hypothetical protein
VSSAEKIFGRIVFVSWLTAWTLGLGFMLLVLLVRPRQWSWPWIVTGSAIRPVLIVHLIPDLRIPHVAGGQSNSEVYLENSQQESPTEPVSSSS